MTNEAEKWRVIQDDLRFDGAALERFSDAPEIVSLALDLIPPDARERPRGILVDLRSDPSVAISFQILVADSVTADEARAFANTADGLINAENDMLMPDPEWSNLGTFRVIFMGSAGDFTGA